MLLTSPVSADDVFVIDVDFDKAYTAEDVNVTITDKHKKIYPFNRYFEYFGEYIDEKSSAKIKAMPNHGDDVLKVIFDQCPNCEQNKRLVDLKNMSESFHFESYHQYFYYLTKKTIENDENIFVVNLSLSNKWFPHYSIFSWHLDLISLIKDNNSFIVHAAGNIPDYDLSSEHNDFESIINMSDCVLLNLSNSWLVDLLAFILKKNIMPKDSRFCKRNINAEEWLVYVGSVDKDYVNSMVRPGLIKENQSSFVVVRPDDIPDLKGKLFTSIAAAYISGKLMKAQGLCKDRESVKKLFWRSVDKSFIGYSPEMRGRGVFVGDSFDRFVNSMCT